MIRSSYAPQAVVTLPPGRSGRHSDYADIRQDAAAAGIAVIEAADINDPDVVARLRQLDLDHVFVIGWSQICRSEFLAVARRGCIGFHPSLLPLNRGRAVVPWTILQGIDETGSTLFLLDDGMDSGDILAQERIPVAPDETAASLYSRHLDALGRMLENLLPSLATGSFRAQPQDHSRATYCARRTAADGLIDWRATAREVWTLIRATGRPYPGAFTFSRGRRVTVWEATLVGPGPYWGLPGQVQRLDHQGALVQCGDRQHVLLTEVQLEDGDVSPAADFLRNHEKLGVDVLEFIRYGDGV